MKLIVASILLSVALDSSAMSPAQGLSTDELRFTFQVAADAYAPDRYDSNPSCREGKRPIPECLAFHYTLRNLSSSPVRNVTYSCMNTGITLEYRMISQPWTPLPMHPPHACSRNLQQWSALLPGGTAQGSFFLADLEPSFDMTPLRLSRRYMLRFTFHSDACLASPDASACVSWPEVQPVALADAVSVTAP